MKNRLHANGIAALLLTLLVTAASTESPVADAAQRNDTETVRALLRDGSDVNGAQGDGMTALHWAGMQGNAAMVEVLLYAGANSEATTRLGGFTALHLASKNGHAEAITTLAGAGADATSRTATGATPLHLAAASGSAGAVSALVASGAQVDATEGTHEQTPLHWAAAANRLSAMETLIGAGADVHAVTKVIDYVAISAAAAPDRRRRQQVVAAVREADRAAEATQTGATAVAEQPAAQPQAQAGAVTPAQALQAAPQDEDPDDDPDEDPDGAQTLAQDDNNSQLGSDRVPGGATQGTGGTGSTTPSSSTGARSLSYTDLVGIEGGLTPLHYASRDGHHEAAMLLVAAGADVNTPTAGDNTTPLLMATINGNYDIAMQYLELGADPNIVSEDGAAPLFATLNNRWAPKAFYPQPTAFKQQATDYLTMMEALLKAGADINHRTERHIWYASFNFDILGVKFDGATAFWRAAHATDVAAMRLLIGYGADPDIPTKKTPGRSRRGSSDSTTDPSGLEPVPNGGPAVFPIHAASGVGYTGSRAGNSHRHVTDGWLPTVKYLVEELGADVNARDHDGYSAVHHAAARGDNEMIMYLVSQGADVTHVSRRGQTTVDVANGPQQRVQPFPETIALLEGLGAMNNHNCQSCQ